MHDHDICLKMLYIVCNEITRSFNNKKSVRTISDIQFS